MVHASLLGDLQLVQRTLNQSGHRSVLCWQAPLGALFVLRFSTVTLGLRHDPQVPLQDRLSLLATDGSLRPVLPGDLEFYARKFIALSSSDLVPDLAGAALSDTLRANCRRYAAWTEQRTAAWAAALSTRSPLSAQHCRCACWRACLPSSARPCS